MATIVLDNATVLDPDAGALTPDRRVVIADGRIADVAASGAGTSTAAPRKSSG